MRLGLGFRLRLGLDCRLSLGLGFRLSLGLGLRLGLDLGFGLRVGLGCRLSRGLWLRLGLGFRLRLGLGCRFALDFGGIKSLLPNLALRLLPVLSRSTVLAALLLVEFIGSLADLQCQGGRCLGLDLRLLLLFQKLADAFLQ